MTRTRILRAAVAVVSVGFVAGGGSPDFQTSADETAADTVSPDTAVEAESTAAAGTRTEEASRPAEAGGRTRESGARAESAASGDAEEEAPAEEPRTPETTAVTLDAGSQMTVQLSDTLSTRTTATGDPFTRDLARAGD